LSLKYSINENVRNKVKEVVTDMSPSMESIVRKCFPNAIITTDRFHVMKNVLEDLLAVRTRCKTAIKTRILNKKEQRKKE
jgi:transposase